MFKVHTGPRPAEDCIAIPGFTNGTIVIVSTLNTAVKLCVNNTGFLFAIIDEYRPICYINDINAIKLGLDVDGDHVMIDTVKYDPTKRLSVNSIKQKEELEDRYLERLGLDSTELIPEIFEEVIKLESGYIYAIDGHSSMKITYEQSALAPVSDGSTHRFNFILKKHKYIPSSGYCVDKYQKRVQVWINYDQIQELYKDPYEFWIKYIEPRPLGISDIFGEDAEIKCYGVLATVKQDLPDTEVVLPGINTGDVVVIYDDEGQTHYRAIVNNDNIEGLDGGHMYISTDLAFKLGYRIIGDTTDFKIALTVGMKGEMPDDNEGTT